MINHNETIVMQKCLYHLIEKFNEFLKNNNMNDKNLVDLNTKFNLLLSENSNNLYINNSNSIDSLTTKFYLLLSHLQINKNNLEMNFWNLADIVEKSIYDSF